MEKILDMLTIPAVGYTAAGIIVLAILLHHFRQMALIRTGLIKKYGIRGRRIDHDKLFGGLFLVALGGVIAAAKYYHISFWLAFWIFVGLLGVSLIVSALLGQDRWYKISRD
ncbi:MAG TPA: hypothetical protein DG577_04055 [Firmicutes bacterium]|mgnify:FL=1|nr:hypothetical protein [Bacillota bacterium]HBS93987.1 hypothetical protein [Bacillota bacterium]HCX78567.1 hypothetical protein [Bacillota bacterium]